MSLIQVQTSAGAKQMFDRLDEVASANRARSVESFSHFAQCVLGLRVPEPELDRIQHCVEGGETVLLDAVHYPKLPGALKAWMVVAGYIARSEVDLRGVLTETAIWLFPTELAA